jgi:dTDP-4-amino-4,6-dideoxygalactose transaminase
MKNNNKIWISSPHMGGSEEKFVKEAFDTNWVAPIGPNVNGFENDLEKYLGQQSYVSVLSSGTAAIHLGLILLGVKAGDVVLCQTMTFSASANPILYQGATPIFIDSELDTWNLCPKALETAIIYTIAQGKKPKAIVAVHLYGVPYKVDEIHEIANKYDIPILEDSAEALGSSYKGQKCGTFGKISVLSFNGNKIITTSGGGAIVTRTKEINNKAVFFATQSREDAIHYEHKEIGYNYRLSNISAGIGRGQMEVLDEHIQLRRNMHQFYVNIFKNIDEVSVLMVPNNNYFSNHWLTAILITPNIFKGIDREALWLAFNKANIESRPLWKPMHLQPIFSSYPYYGERISESLFENGLCLPSGSNLKDVEKNRIKKVIVDFFK